MSRLQTCRCLLRRRGLSGDDALAEVARLFATTAKGPHRAGSPETVAQADYVRAWSEPDPATGPASSPASGPP